MGRNEEIQKLLSEEELNKVAGGARPKTYMARCLICHARCDWIREPKMEAFKEEHTAQTGHDDYEVTWRW